MITTTGIIVFFLVILFLAIPLTRDPVKKLFGNSALKVYSMIIVILKYILNAHILVFRNLMLPRKIILPTLEKNDQVNFK